MTIPTPETRADRAAVLAVRHLHRPEPFDGTTRAEWSVLRHVTRVCAECGGPDEEYPCPYPCATIEAIDAAAAVTTVTTRAELDTLPERTVLQGRHAFGVLEKVDGAWLAVGTFYRIDPDDVTLPAYVLTPTTKETP